MLEDFLNSEEKLLGIETPLGLSLLPYLKEEGTIVALPVEKEEKYGEIPLLPYEKFLHRLSQTEVGVFFYNPDYIFPLLQEKYKKLILVSPYVLDLDIPWFSYGNIGYGTTLVYCGEEESLLALTKRKAEEVEGRTLIIVPSPNFLSDLLTLLPQVQTFSYGEEITSSLLAVVSSQARLAAWFFLPEVVIDTSRRELLFPTTSNGGGFYKKEVYTSRIEADSLARLSSLGKEGVCYRLLSEKTFSKLPLRYPWPEYIDYSLDKRGTYGLPLSLKNNQVFSLWMERGYPPFSLLGPLVMLDNYDYLLFVYPPAVYHASYLIVAEEQYKTFFSRFRGRDSLETLSKLWETFLEEVGTLYPTYSEVKVWSEQNSLSPKKMWQYLVQVQTSLNVLKEEGVKVKSGPSNPQEVRDLSAPLFTEIYPERRMLREKNGYDYQGRILPIQFLLLPSSLGIEEEEILGILLDENGVIAGISI